MTANRTTALVTGASAGIGAEYCRQLADRCEVIIAVGRDEGRLAEIDGEVGDRAETHTLAADLATLEGVTRTVEMLRQKGPVDYLVNNAGFAILGTFADLDLAPQQAMVDLHLTASLELCRAAVPFMRERGGGYIVNVSSMAAFYGIPGCSVYGASKVALNLFSEALALEEAGNGIRVQALCPGFTWSSFHDRETMAGFDRAAVPEDQWMTAEEVVGISLAALDDGPVVLVPGEANLERARELLQAQLDRL
jgi:short-subunit dehydrogenase